jgi:hypothetical protein
MGGKPKGIPAAPYIGGNPQAGDIFMPIFEFIPMLAGMLKFILAGVFTGGTPNSAKGDGDGGIFAPKMLLLLLLLIL